MINKNLFKKIITTFILVIFQFSLVNFTQVQVLSLSSYEQQKQDIASKRKTISDGLASVSSDLEDVTQLSSTLSAEIKKKQAEIETTNKLIKNVNDLIDILNSQIVQNEKSLNDLITQMKSMLIELQKQNETSPFENIITSKSLSEAISRVYDISTLQSKADTLRLRIETTNQELEQNKKEQTGAKEQLESTKFLLSAQKSTLEDLKNKTSNDEAKYQQLKKNLITENARLEEQNRQAELNHKAEIDAANKAAAEERARQQAQASSSRSTNGSNNNGSGNESSSNGNGNNYGSVSCWFEDPRPLNIPKGYLGKPAEGNLERVFDSCHHDGADISNSTNTLLYAVADGVVVKKGSGDIYGYGNYVVIKSQLPSGQQIYSLYAHMNTSSPKNITEVVKKGQVVGYMGCTGLCYGTHVHFMIYSDTFEKNGAGCRLGNSKCYNPAKYIDL